MYFHHITFLKENYSFLIIIFITLYETAEPQFIRPVVFSKKEKKEFVTAPSDLSIHLFEMQNSYENIHVDFGKHQEQIIIVRDAISVKLKLAYEIYSPDPKIYQILKNEFCYQKSMTSETFCNEIPKVNGDMIWFKMNFTVRWLEKKTGFKLTIDPPNNSNFDISGFYYFRSTAPQSGMILSNFLEIRDILYWSKNLVMILPETKYSTYTLSLNSSEIPKQFSCFDQNIPFNMKDVPNWYSLEFKSLVKWAWCPVSKQTSNIREKDKTYADDCLKYSISQCSRSKRLCPIQTGSMAGWNEIVTFNGTIILTKGEEFPNYNGKLDGFALMCYLQFKTNKAVKFIAHSYDQPKKEFAKGLQWVTVTNNRLDILPISSLNQTIKVGILKQNLIFTAFYLGPNNYTYEWIRNDKVLYNSVKWKIGPYSLQYISKVTADMAGLYHLRVKSLSQIVEFIFILEILSPPILVSVSNEPILSTVYLMVNSNYSINFMYKGGPTHANIYINGVQYKPGISVRKVFLNDLSQKAFNLKHLDFDFTQKTFLGDLTGFTYSVKNVLFPDTLLRGQDHNLIVEVINEYGVSRTMLNIYVLKAPKFVNFPQNDNCTTPCSSLQPHLFRCELETDYYTAREVHVHKFWFVNDIRLDSLPYHNLFFKSDSKGLHLSPIRSNNSEYDHALKLLLKTAKLICRVRLLYPGSMDMTEAKLLQEKRIIYDTSHDSSSLSHFVAEIRLDQQPEINSASYTWIIFLCIALLLIVMFLFLLVKFTLRGQGRSYQIEKLEEKMGYNRDQEIENETIKPYHRSSVNNTKSRSNNYNKDSVKDNSYHSLNYSPSHGNGTFRPRDVLDIIDDEENAIDPNKFNEEGSFIGVYAAKNTNQSNNLPPEISSGKL